MVGRKGGARPDKTGRKIQIRWRYRGRPYAETLDIRPTKAGLEQAVRIRADRIAALKYGPQVVTDALSFSQVAQMYLDHAPIALSTHHAYRDALNIYWMPVIGHLSVREIRYATLKRIDENIKWRSQKTRTNVITPLRQVFSYALELDLADHNPALKFRVRRAQKDAPDPYDLAERAALLDALKGSYAYLYFRLAFDTGMRTGELLALHWSDYDGESLKVVRSKVRREEKKSTKTNKVRRVMIGDPETRELLDAERNDIGHIVTNQYGRPYQSAYHLNQELRRAHKDTSIRRRTGPYPWRHTYASLGLMAGLPPGFLAKQLGHSLDMFYRTYATWISGDNDRELAGKMAAALSKSVANSA